jgi:hypothetical protein
MYPLFDFLIYKVHSQKYGVARMLKNLIYNLTANYCNSLFIPVGSGAHPSGDFSLYDFRSKNSNFGHQVKSFLHFSWRHRLLLFC